jgi:hypothetical protein
MNIFIVHYLREIGAKCLALDNAVQSSPLFDLSVSKVSWAKVACLWCPQINTIKPKALYDTAESRFAAMT